MMRFLKRLFYTIIFVIVVTVIGTAVFLYKQTDSGVNQSAGQVAIHAGSSLVSAVTLLSSRATELAEKISGIIKSERTSSSDGTPAIPLATKITAAPASGEAQSQVSAPAAVTDLKSEWGETGIQGLTVYEYGKSLLNDNEKGCYCKIATAIQNVQAQVAITSNIRPTQIKKIYEYYLYDHAEVFYINGVSLNYSDWSGSYSYTFSFDYKYNGDKNKIISMRTQLGKKALNVLSAAKGFSTDLKKEKALHDRLIKLCSYDIKAAQDSDAYPDSYSAYGAFVNNKAVCQGYAQAMKLLLSSAGIKSLYVTGQANGGSHAWNMVLVGGKWRYLDATFDDPVFTDSDGNYTNAKTVSYTYFNYKGNSGHTTGTFDSVNPFSGNSENYATMPKIS